MVYGPFYIPVYISRWFYLAVVASKHGIKIFLDGIQVVGESLKTGIPTDVNTGHSLSLVTGCSSTNRSANVAFKSINVWWFEMEYAVIEYMQRATQTGK